MIRPPVVATIGVVDDGATAEALVVPALVVELASDLEPLHAAIAVRATPMPTMSGICRRLVLR